MKLFKEMLLALCISLSVLGVNSNTSFAHILSYGEEYQIGYTALQEYEAKYNTYKDTEVESIYNELITKNNLPYRISSERSFKEIKVSNEETVNAFELPGGFIVVTEDMKTFLSNSTDKSALAFVIAHEMSHHINEDYLRKYDKKFATGLLFSLLTPKLQGYDTLYASAAEDLITTLNSRQMNFRTEQQADEKGIELLLQSNEYSLGGSAVFFSKLMELEKKIKISDNFTYPHSKSEVRLSRSLEQIKKISNNRVEIKNNQLYLDGSLLGKTGRVSVLKYEDYSEIEKTYIVAGNLAKAIYRGEWRKDNIYSFYNNKWEHCKLYAGDIFIGEFKTENNEDNIPLELFYSLSKFYNVKELPFLTNLKDNTQFKF